MTSKETKISAPEWYASARSAFSKARKKVISTDIQAAPGFLSIPKLSSSYHPHPALPLPRLKGGGIFDKGEGFGGGEKWDLLYYQDKVRRSFQLKIIPTT